jgi:hypothetical protein
MQITIGTILCRRQTKIKSTRSFAFAVKSFLNEQRTKTNNNKQTYLLPRTLTRSHCLFSFLSTNVQI